MKTIWHRLREVRATQKTRSREPFLSWEWVLVAALLAVYGLSRFLLLELRPFFVDEATYARMADIIRHEPSRLWLPLTDGKTPLHMWLVALMWPLLELVWGDDPKVIIRGASALAGVLSLGGIVVCARILGGRLAGWVAGVLWLSTPFVVLHDRLGITDGMMTAASIWFGVVSIVLARRPARWWHGVAAAMGFFVCYMMKPQCLLLLSIYPGAVVVMGWGSLTARWRSWAGSFLLYGALATLLVQVTVAQNPAAEQIGDVDTLTHKAAFYLPGDMPFGERAQAMADNAAGAADTLVSYVGWPVIVAAGVGFVLLMLFGRREAMFFAGWLATVTLPLFAVLALWYPRYYCLAVPPLVLLAGVGLAALEYVDRQWGLTAAAGLVVVHMLVTGPMRLRLISEPLEVDYVNKDRFQFVTAQTSGRGMEKVVAAIAELAKRGPTTLLVDNWLGHPGDTLALFLGDHPNLRIIDVWWFNEQPFWHPGLRVMTKTRHERLPIGEVTADELRGAYVLTNDVAYPETIFQQRHPMLSKLAEIRPDGLRGFKYVLWRIPEQSPGVGLRGQ